MICWRKYLFLATLLVILNRSEGAFIQEFIRTTLQDNVAGAPIIHQLQEFEFDPDVSMKRRQQFYELHGYRGDKLIERLGLGIDGKAAERLVQQRIRDQDNPYASDNVYKTTTN